MRFADRHRRPEPHDVGLPGLGVDRDSRLETPPVVAQVALDVAQAFGGGVVGVGAAGELEAFRLELLAPRLELRETRRGHVVRMLADRALGQRLVRRVVVVLDERAAHGEAALVAAEPTGWVDETDAVTDGGCSSCRLTLHWSMARTTASRYLSGKPGGSSRSIWTADDQPRLRIVVVREREAGSFGVDAALLHEAQRVEARAGAE